MLWTFLNKPEVCNFVKRETLTQVFSCEFYEFFLLKEANFLELLKSKQSFTSYWNTKKEPKTNLWTNVALKMTISLLQISKLWILYFTISFRSCVLLGHSSICFFFCFFIYLFFGREDKCVIYHFQLKLALITDYIIILSLFT